MRKQQRDRQQVLQTSLQKAAPPHFGNEDLEAWHCLVRITREFYDYLQHTSSGSRNEDDLSYALETILSGLGSFRRVNSAYRISVGARKSTLKLRSNTMSDLSKQFLAQFEAFTKEKLPMKSCRLLLDLFKL